MKLAELSEELRARIRSYRYDSIVEKHEGPWSWASMLEHYDPEILDIHGYAVLLPCSRDLHPNITILRADLAASAQSLTVFLKDTSYMGDPAYERFEAGRLVFCDRVPGSELYLAVVYHPWFITDQPNATFDAP